MVFIFFFRESVKEDGNVSDFTGVEGDTEDSFDSDNECTSLTFFKWLSSQIKGHYIWGSAQFIKDNRSNSTGDLGDFSETTEFKRHSKTKSCGTSLFLFVRSAREKERWFHRFVFSIYRLYKTCIFFTGISFFAGYAKPPANTLSHLIVPIPSLILLQFVPLTAFFKIYTFLFIELK